MHRFVDGFAHGGHDTLNTAPILLYHDEVLHEPGPPNHLPISLAWVMVKEPKGDDVHFCFT